MEYHVETSNDENKEYLNSTKLISGKKSLWEKLLVLSFGLYYTNIRMIESLIIENKRFDNTFNVSHDSLDHPESIMMRRITETSSGHSLKNHNIFQANELSCSLYSQGN